MSERIELPVREERCETCHFWVRHGSKFSSGDCRAYPPRVSEALLDVLLKCAQRDYFDDNAGENMPPYELREKVYDEIAYATTYPQPDGSEWCGEWRAKGGMKQIDANYTSEDRKADAERLKSANDKDALAILRRMQQRTSPPDTPTVS